jgi:hypothetical protein
MIDAMSSTSMICKVSKNQSESIDLYRFLKLNHGQFPITF